MGNRCPQHSSCSFLPAAPLASPPARAHVWPCPWYTATSDPPPPPIWPPRPQRPIFLHDRPFSFIHAVPLSFPDPWESHSGKCRDRWGALYVAQEHVAACSSPVAGSLHVAGPGPSLCLFPYLYTMGLSPRALSVLGFSLGSSDRASPGTHFPDGEKHH